ncbi:MAG: transposase [Planctomycetia bacterium]|nr:transposase [Planctomycetia bacterium]
MSTQQPHRKRVKHYHEPGDFHELTFSCYHRMKLLTNDAWRGYLSRSIDAAASAEEFLVLAFVFMPEHVHLLVFPSRPAVDAESISRFLAEVKRPCSLQVKADLMASGSRLLQRLTIRERPDRWVFRFWQEGPGYDRNLNTPTSVMAAIDYIHLNPVRRGLVKQAGLWRWSSARWHLSDGQDVDPCLPRLHRLPSPL